VSGAVSMHPRKPHPWWTGTRAAVLGDVRTDLRGGTTAGLLTFVTAISYAAVAGAPLGPGMTSAAALSGLIGAAVGGLVAAALGPAKTQVFSPRASVAVVIASAAATFDAQLGAASITQTLGWLSACLLLAALMQAGFGLLRMGALIRLIPHCVTSGFMVGIAIEMAWSQWPALLPAGAAATQLAAYAPLAIGLACVGAIACVQWQPRWQHLRGWAMPIGLLVAVLFCEGLQSTLSWTVPHLRAVEFASAPFVSLMQALGVVLGVARDGPAAALLPQVLVFALVIAFINSIETLTCVLALETRLQQRFDANRALMASAAGSLAAVCMGGLPVAGGTAASMANVDAGARSRGSAVTAALTVALLAAVGHDIIDRIPLAAVAGVSLTVAFALALTPVREMAWQRRATRSELAVACLVGLLLLTAGSAVALLCGVLAVSVLAVMQMRRSVVRREYDAAPAPATDDEQQGTAPSFAQKIRVLEVGQPLLFATVESVVQAIEAHRQTARFVVLDLTHVSALDASAARTLASCASAMAALDQALLIVRSPRGPNALHAIYGCEHFDGVDDALKHCVAGLQRQRACHDELRPRRVDAGRMPSDEQALATQLLLPYVGPIARVLVKQACAQSTDRQQLYGLLAQHLPHPQSSQAFLDAAGFGNEALVRRHGGFGT
jgi:sulfate permease, SulP family